MNIRPTAIAALAGLAMGPGALAQVTCADVGDVTPNCVFNPGFEQPKGTNLALPTKWRVFNSAIRRYVGDGLSPTVTPHTGIACMELPSGWDFNGFDTDVFNSAIGLYNDPVYSLHCGTVRACAWYLMPSGNGLLDTNAGIKLEFRRPDLSVYKDFEDLVINANTYPADGQWHQYCMVISRADLDYIYNRDNNGAAYDLPPNRVSILPLRYAPGAGGTGTIFWDDVTYEQYDDPNTSKDEEIWDDKNVDAFARRLASITEPAIPVYLDKVTPGGPASYRIGNGCTTNSTYQLVEVYDKTPSGNGFPLTWADIVANGHVRPTVQKSDGTSTAFGTSFVAQPGFRPNGGALSLVPTMSQARVNATWVTSGPPDNVPARANPFGVTVTGTYPGAASVSSTRLYPDQALGTTQFTVGINFSVTGNINLTTGRGNDAFRIAWLSSMLANLAGGQYDADFLAVTNGANTRTIRIPDAPRGVYLYPSPQTIGVGDSFTLYKDTAATWNPGGTTVKVKLVSLSGAPGALGVQGFLSSSTNPNDDSLSVWLEWVGAPATITAGTNITATLEITATPATPKGDGDHNGVINCADVTLLNGILGQNSSSPTFNAYVDMNNDGVIDANDRAALNTLAGGGCAPPPCTGDLNGDGVINTGDLTQLLVRFGQSVTPGSTGDLNSDGTVNTADLTLLLVRFGTSCP